MVNIAVLGFGVVGSGVVELLETNHAKIAGSAAQEIRVKYILDIRSFPDSPYAALFVDNFDIIENDPDIQIVVETIGGTGIAYEYTKRSLLASKNVVTSNKELVAAHGYELLELARQTNLNYLFEASVGGGIPILRPITQCLAANEITEIYGILNGTTNYILSQMIKNESTLASALNEAQRLGYAEANPSSDLEGKDTCRKICILADLAFGSHIPPELVPTEGIEHLSTLDISYAKRVGAKIKLVGRALRTPQGIAAYVAPHFVTSASLLSNVEDVFNCILVRGNAIGDTMFYGKGAGKMPTASAVVADIIDAAKHFHARKYIYWSYDSKDILSDSALLPERWYVRANISKEAASDIFGDMTLIAFDETSGDTAFITDYFTLAELRDKCSDFELSAIYRVLE